MAEGCCPICKAKMSMTVIDKVTEKECTWCWKCGTIIMDDTPEVKWIPEITARKYFG